MVRMGARGVIFCTATAFMTLPAFAQTLTTIGTFSDIEGYYPNGGLIADHAGNLYGTTLDGGEYGAGTVFELTPPAKRSRIWSQTVLTSSNGAPRAGLVADKAGNFYGTTSGGGNGHGTVFELSPPGPGQTSWTQTVLASFDAENGDFPSASLILDRRGNLYGTAAEGGTSPACDGGCGTVFEVSPPAGHKKTWTLTALTSFTGTTAEHPFGALILDSAGNLYGTSLYGGNSACLNGCGTVFEVSPPAAGQTAWTTTVLTSFDGVNGSYPLGSLIADSAGNFYGTTIGGGAAGDGTVFELSPPQAGQTAWTETVLFSFSGNDGDGPLASLIFDSAGNLYGTTNAGGGAPACAADGGCGTVFELMPPTSGQTAWTETVLAAFDGRNGYSPLGSLLAGKGGVYYGTTVGTGDPVKGHVRYGTVFRLKP